MVQISLSRLVNLLICSTRDKYSVLLVANMRGAFIDARPARQWRVVKINKNEHSCPIYWLICNSILKK